MFLTMEGAVIALVLGTVVLVIAAVSSLVGALRRQREEARVREAGPRVGGVLSDAGRDRASGQWLKLYVGLHGTRRLVR